MLGASRAPRFSIPDRSRRPWRRSRPARRPPPRGRCGPRPPCTRRPSGRSRRRRTAARASRGAGRPRITSPGRPLGDVALGERVDAPVALEQRVGLARRVAVEPDERRQHLGPADGAGAARKCASRSGPTSIESALPPCGQVEPMMPSRVGEAVGARRPPDGLGERGDDLGGERLALAVQAREPRVGDAGDGDVAQRADRERADDRLGAQLLAARERDAARAAGVQRDDVRAVAGRARRAPQPSRAGARRSRRAGAGPPSGRSRRPPPPRPPRSSAAGRASTGARSSRRPSRARRGRAAGSPPGRAPSARSQPANESASSAAASGWLHGSAGSTVAASCATRASNRSASATSAGVKNGG